MQNIQKLAGKILFYIIMGVIALGALSNVYANYKYNSIEIVEPTNKLEDMQRLSGKFVTLDNEIQRKESLVNTLVAEINEDRKKVNCIIKKNEMYYNGKEYGEVKDYACSNDFDKMIVSFSR